MCNPDGPKFYEKRPLSEYIFGNNQKCSPTCDEGFDLTGIEGNTVHRCVCKRDGCNWTKDPTAISCKGDEPAVMFAPKEKGKPSCPHPPQISTSAGTWACDGMNGVALPWKRGSEPIRLKHGIKCMLQCNSEDGYAAQNLNGRNVSVY